jgi:hypothetical protein
MSQSQPSRALIRHRAKQAVRQLSIKLVLSWTKAGIPVPEQRRLIREFRRAVREFNSSEK